ncbi:MAG: FG-GAP repeat protein [Planctomycetota bacterium]
MSATIRFLGVAVILWALAPPDAAVWAQCTEKQKLTAGDAAAGDWFGKCVSMSGDVAVVGAQYEDGVGTNRGAAYVYGYDGTSWVQEQKLGASDPADSDYFGWRVSVDGDVLIVGAPYDDDKGTDSGSAYVYRYNGTSWDEEKKLTASDGAPGDQYGYSLAVDGDLMLVGAPYDDDKGPDSGSVYVYTYMGPVLKWVLVQKLTGGDATGGEYFGYCVSLRGDVVVVGAPWDAWLYQGSVYVYRAQGGTWHEEQKLIPADPAYYDTFGYSVSTTGEVVLVGSPGDDDQGDASGSAYVFVHGGDTWVQDQKLTARDGRGSDLFGYSVSLDGDVMVVGAPGGDTRILDTGCAYVYYLCGTWVEAKKLGASDSAGADSYGNSVSVSGDRAIVGAPFDDDAGGDSGSAYVHAARPELELWIDPVTATQGDTVTFTVCCGYPGDPVALFLMMVNGVPYPRMILVWTFGPDHKLTLPATIPAGLAGTGLTFQSFKLAACGGVVGSNLADLTIH